MPIIWLCMTYGKHFIERADRQLVDASAYEVLTLQSREASSRLGGW